MENEKQQSLKILIVENPRSSQYKTDKYGNIYRNYVMYQAHKKVGFYI